MSDADEPYVARLIQVCQLELLVKDSARRKAFQGRQSELNYQ